MTKKEWYEAGVSKYRGSKILFENKDYHNSVYIGGYTLEILYKLILIISGKKTEEELKVHLNSSKGRGPKKVENFLKEEVYYRLLKEGRNSNEIYK